MTTQAPLRDVAVLEVRRLINDHIAEVAIRLDDRLGEPFDFVCECGDLRCGAFVSMTIVRYQATSPGDVRAQH